MSRPLETYAQLLGSFESFTEEFNSNEERSEYLAGVLDTKVDREKLSLNDCYHGRWY